MSLKDDEERFQKWAQFIRKNIDFGSDKLLRYFWDLYSTLIDEIQELNQQLKFKNNGKKP